MHHNSNLRPSIFLFYITSMINFIHALEHPNADDSKCICSPKLSAIQLGIPHALHAQHIKTWANSLSLSPTLSNYFSSSIAYSSKWYHHSPSPITQIPSLGVTLNFSLASSSLTNRLLLSFTNFTFKISQIHPPPSNCYISFILSDFHNLDPRKWFPLAISPSSSIQPFFTVVAYGGWSI